MTHIKKKKNISLLNGVYMIGCEHTRSKSYEFFTKKNAIFTKKKLYAPKRVNSNI